MQDRDVEFLHRKLGLQNESSADTEAIYKPEELKQTREEDFEKPHSSTYEYYEMESRSPPRSSTFPDFFANSNTHKVESTPSAFGGPGYPNGATIEAEERPIIFESTPTGDLEYHEVLAVDEDIDVQLDPDHSSPAEPEADQQSSKQQTSMPVQLWLVGPGAGSEAKRFLVPYNEVETWEVIQV